jgi:PPM family protein phosphatase
MLRVVEQAHKSDTGRQRRANEDAYFARAPVFAVADGMGGAQAGEVASRIAADAFEPQLREEAPEQQLGRIVRNANKRIHELAKADASRAGMGTTLTAALLRGEEISFAHVGDSRAYRWRDGELKQLTGDHSLVEELRRQGRLTDEQAVDHPQRSIITRALGPEPDVEVDTMTMPARAGDVYLLCTDGLTTMVGADRIAELIAEAKDLDDAVRKLIAQANENGGRDNITAVAFRIEEAGARDDDEEAQGDGEDGGDDGAGEDLTLVGPTAQREGLTAEALRAAAARGRELTGPGGRWRRAAKTVTALLVVAAIAAGTVYGLRSVYFLGADPAGRVALYRGVPYDLPLHIRLYERRYSTVIQVGSLSPRNRASATRHKLRSRSDAVSLIRFLEQQQGVRK